MQNLAQRRIDQRRGQRARPGQKHSPVAIQQQCQADGGQGAGQPDGERIDFASGQSHQRHGPATQRRPLGKHLALLAGHDPIAGVEHFAGGIGPARFLAADRHGAKPAAKDQPDDRGDGPKFPFAPRAEALGDVARGGLIFHA